MIQVIISDKVIIGPDEEEIFELDLQTIRPSFHNKGKTLVYDANLNGLTKDQLDTVIDNATQKIKIFSNSAKIIEGKRQGKDLKIDRSDNNIESNPWNITQAIFEVTDRKELFEYLKENRVQLWMPLMIMISNYDKLKPENMKVLERIETWFPRVRNEMLYAMIAFGMKPQHWQFAKWRFPKKGDKK